MKGTTPIALCVMLFALAACQRREPGQAAVRDAPPRPTTAAASKTSEPSTALACPPLHPDLPEVTSMGDDPPVPDVVDPYDTLAPFFEKVAAHLRGRATDHIRIGVYGDSNGTMDYITGQMRRRLQTSYGDGGHGFVALARPWDWYRHRDVHHDAMIDAWEAFAVSTHPAYDNQYGFGLIAAESRQGGAVTWVASADEGAPVGRTFDRVDVYYLKWPQGGAFDIKVDGDILATVDTHDKVTAAGFYRLDLRDTRHRVSFVSKSSAHPVRLFGVTLERAAPGVVVDGLGVGSLNCPSMLRDKRETTDATLRHRKYDLLITHVGTNTFTYGNNVTCMSKVIERYHEALPGLPVMVMTPPDYLGSQKPPHSPKWLLQVSSELRDAASANRVAFFDFREAMGGDGSIVRFQDNHMTQGDFVHLNEKGGAYMGDRVVYALWKGFAGYVARHPTAGCD